MSDCHEYNPDDVFKRFKVIEFPVSFVGLATEKYLDLETNLARDAYLKTMCDGALLKFEEARQISASHRAFHLVHVNDTAVKITFKPINECISNPKSQKTSDQKFIFDLRLIHVDGYRCCNNEFHSEIGRYYICGQYEFCNLSNFPKCINFGEVFMNTEVVKYVRIKNDSSFNATRMESIKTTGFDVQPNKFVIQPHSSVRLKIVFKPTCLVMNNKLTFEVRNPHNWRDGTNETIEENKKEETNCLSYSISCKLNVKYNTVPKVIVVESLHKLIEPDKRFTYVSENDIRKQKERKEIAKNHLDVCKSYLIKKPKLERFCTGRDHCYSDISLPKEKRLPKNFCKPVIPRINLYAVFDVLFIPNILEFGRIACDTYGEKEVKIINNTPFEITINLQVDDCIFYTTAKLSTLSFKLRAQGITEVTLMCLGYVDGNYEGTFNYQIDKKYSRKHKYSLQVGNPTLRVLDNCLKFGMVTSDSFITSVPIKIYNDFNVPVEYKWNDINSEVPFDIIPKSGEVPEHSCKICDVMYVCKPTKTKTHEVDLNSLGYSTRVIPMELNVMTRKITVKFLQPSVMFKDIALNIRTVETVKLENSSREIATFYVVEPLIPGFTMEPMHGNIRPKTVITFEMIVQVSCVLEFGFDVVVKVNNKENIIIAVSGNVVEPKLTIQPKNIYMARIPLGMITYVPITFQNSGTVKTVVEILDTGDENIFDVYTIGYGNEKHRIFEFCLDMGQSKTVFIKVLDVFRREYDMYVPIKVNGLLGPPEFISGSTELQKYVGPYESQYESNVRVKIKNVSKDIPYCRIYGVITVSWIQFSQEKFELNYVPNGNNTIEFTMKNVSKYLLFVTILASKLSPAFSLNARTENNESLNTDNNNIKFEMYRETEVELTLKFHPKMNGRFISTALLFLDKHMTIPYYNLTFIGKRVTPTMTPSTHRILFPPSYVGTKLSRRLTVQMGFAADLDQFSSSYKAEKNLIINFLDCKIVTPEDGELYSILTAEINIKCNTEYGQNLVLTINHECGSGCEIEIIFLFTQCILTLHANQVVSPECNPYPYFPLNSQTELYEYMTNCTQFLEKWMFQQGFRRDLYPAIPDTFHAISTFLSSQFVGGKAKGINVTILNFMKRIAGPMMKHFQKPSSTGVEESFKGVKEVYDTYKQILNMLRSRGSDLRMLQAKFLLSYEQYVVYTENVTPTSNTENLTTQELLGNPELFYRLSKQCWIDLILQCYKVFVVESCFFDCVCISNEKRDIVKILVNWYNAQIVQQHSKLLGKSVPYKPITNLTTDLMDGIALASAMLTHCPFLSKHFEIFLASDNSKESLIIHNACLLIEAMNLLRLYFPLTSADFLEPNFLQMLFLSIHLYVVLPMFKPRDVVQFNPPLLRSSTRNVGVCPATQESLIFNYILLNNNRNSFSVEKVPSTDNGKKMFLGAKYTAHFVDEEECVLLLHGYNKTRIFDTYIIFILKGCVGALNPHKKCRVTGPLYRPNKVEVLVSTPFSATAIFNVHITEKEPSIPVEFECMHKPKFYLRRLNLIENEISLIPAPKDSGPDSEQKIYLQLMCLCTQVGNSWLWFRSEIGEFYIRITTQPRWDLAVDTLQAKVDQWPVEPCSCGEACECYRTSILSIPHRNDLMVKALRYSLLEFASDTMMSIFDQLIETRTGKLILCTLLEEGGTNMNDVRHILRNEIKYRITTKTLIPQIDRVVLFHHSSSVFPLPVTLPLGDKAEKYSITFTSECGMDIRTYRILFVAVNYSTSDTSRSS